MRVRRLLKELLDEKPKMREEAVCTVDSVHFVVRSNGVGGKALAITDCSHKARHAL